MSTWLGERPRLIDTTARNINGKILKNEIKNVVAEKWESKQDRGKL